MVDLLRVRLGDADALNDPAIHSFTELIRGQGEHIPDQWYWNALEELEAWRRDWMVSEDAQAGVRSNFGPVSLASSLDVET